MTVFAVWTHQLAIVIASGRERFQRICGEPCRLIRSVCSTKSSILPVRHTEKRFGGEEANIFSDGVCIRTDKDFLVRRYTTRFSLLDLDTILGTVHLLCGSVAMLADKFSETRQEHFR